MSLKEIIYVSLVLIFIVLIFSLAVTVICNKINKIENEELKKDMEDEL